MPNPLECSWKEINTIDKTLSVMRRSGLGPGNLGYNELWKLRGKLFGQMGFRKPTVPAVIKLLMGLSPGEIRVWNMGEKGFMTEAREKPGAPPVYHHVSDEMAIALLKGDLTHELETELMKPDEYLGE
jgi:hypothetical protein